MFEFFNKKDSHYHKITFEEFQNEKIEEFAKINSNGLVLKSKDFESIIELLQKGFENIKAIIDFNDKNISSDKEFLKAIFNNLNENEQKKLKNHLNNIADFGEELSLLYPKKFIIILKNFPNKLKGGFSSSFLGSLRGWMDKGYAKLIFLSTEYIYEIEDEDDNYMGSFITNGVFHFEIK